MITLSRRALLASTLLPLGAALAPARAQSAPDFGKVAPPIFSALAKANDIPGLVVGITRKGEHEILAIGQTARTGGQPVDGDTLFELGSVSKTFIVALAALAAERGQLDLNAPLEKVAQRLTGTAFGALTPLDLATHATGGMPLQLPDSIRNEKELVEWLAAWKPAAPPATRRAYSNISIGVLGLVTATALGVSFPRAAQRDLFPLLGLNSTYIDVPEDAMARYAMGTTKDNKPARLTPGLLGPEAYGVKSTALDMLTFLDANMGVGTVEPDMARALARTHTGYFETKSYVQEMVWERYPWPVGRDRLLAGNSADMAMKPQPITRLDPPSPPAPASFINKTGSTNGFGSYVVMLPAEKLGIVVLANRNYPNEERVKAVYALVEGLRGA
ncbi:class C beta-lactamase [Ancylobacter vacuolatus]|uniref:Beta-lactamase n=1 Tax=Ancylobacter vacuolatus TaxID=223389 RepID=A0ABU0DMB0_9HYPH|nr:class C beta-lactamase [Ancylobacter vacuolatus]MDQ0349509.1 beta-lactamase class C [Ancylobacter vacuolatus]